LAPDVTGGLVAVGGFLDASGTLLVRMRYETPDANRETCVDGVDADGDGLAGCDDPDCRLRCAPMCAYETPFAECQGPRCGDGEVSVLEDYLLCPTDAPRP
jgi:hypothetical protein